jgi:dTDP-4-amino-4,6-dideoxygalactose transaminase
MSTDSRTVPFVDLSTQHNQLREDLDRAISCVRKSSQFILGPQLASFEEEFAAYVGTQHCIGVGSGTEALHLALRALDIGPGDEVIVPSHTFIATAFAVSATGARPIFAEIDARTYLLDPASARERITPNTRALIPVHIYGRCVDMEPFLDLAAQHDLFVVEDAAQAHGAERGSGRAGSMGDIGCFSFYPSKNLGAFGDAGAVVTSDKALAERVRLLRNYCQPEKYHHTGISLNSRLDELQAAVLRVKLPHLDAWNAARRTRAELYRELLADVDLALPDVGTGSQHVCHLFVVRATLRTRLQRFLSEAGIDTQIHYPVPAHRQPPYAANGDSLPETERVAQEVLSLPLFPELAHDDVRRVCRALLDFESELSLPGQRKL